MLTAHTVGSKYKEVKDKPLTEITKLIRKDLKDKFKDCKFRVYKTHYSGLTIRLTECKNPDKKDEWQDVTRRETIEGAETAINGSVKHFTDKLEAIKGPKVVKTFE